MPLTAPKMEQTIILFERLTRSRSERSMFNVALFGAGRIGRIHARNAAARSDFNLKYIVDPDREAAGPPAQLTGAVVVDSDAALGDASISGVIIASSTNAHLDQVLLAAAAGKSIFCEK